MSRNLALALALLTATLAGCKKKEAEQAPAPETPPPATELATPAAEPPATPPAATPAASAGTLRLLVGHEPAKEGDPVVVEVPGVRVVSASFTDPKDLTGGTATLEVDLSTLSSGNATRDEDLKGNYFEIATFPKATVVIKDVAKGAGEGAYKATADLDVRGVKGTVPVEFQVVEAMADAVKVKGTAKLSRMDFKVGKPNSKDNPTGEDVTVELEMTVAKS